MFKLFGKRIKKEKKSENLLKLLLSNPEDFKLEAYIEGETIKINITKKPKETAE